MYSESLEFAYTEERWEFGSHSALITVGNHPCEEELPNKGSYPKEMCLKNVILQTSLYPQTIHILLDLVF